MNLILNYIMLIEIISFIWIVLSIWAGITIYQMKKQVDTQQQDIEDLKRKFIRLKKSINSEVSEEEEIQFEFMKNRPD